MKIGLLLNSNGKLCPYSEKFKEILILNDLPYLLIDPNSDTLVDELKSCSHLIFRHSMGDTDKLIYDSVFNIANNVLNLKCFPDYEIYWPHENKIKEYYLLKSHNVPVLESRVIWNYRHADAFLKETSFPVVAKLPKGAGSSNVIIIKSVREGKTIINQIFNEGVRLRRLKSRSNLASFSKMGIYKYGRLRLKSNLIDKGLIEDKREYPQWQIQKDTILFQRFLPGNEFDTRITVIGNRAFGFRRFVRENDFRASGSGKIDMDTTKIDRRCVKIAFDVSEKLNFSTMAYDFIYDTNKEPWINEISYGFIDSVLQRCTGFWDKEFIWHNKQNWPQYYQLSDFLSMDNLKEI